MFRITGFRDRRMRVFVDEVMPGATSILDCGGTKARPWIDLGGTASVVVLNIRPAADTVATNVRFVQGDARSLPYGDSSFDIGFSNSTIEHVGSLADQFAFGAEIRRVGRRIWVQAPAFECPIEPHFIAPFVHWIPDRPRAWVVRRLTPWGWLTRPSREEAEAMVREVRLPRSWEFQAMFPDCEIRVERVFGLPKSYIAVR